MIRLLIVLAFACTSIAHAAESATNTLTEQEKAAGWKLLFDGSSTEGWVSLGKDAFPSSGWSVKDGTLSLAKGPGGGDIVTAEQFTDYEFRWEWRAAPGANGGVKYNLVDPKKAIGCEYQLIDDLAHPDSSKVGPVRQTASLYDVLPPAADKVLKPAGEWNQSLLMVKGNQVEHWLNGKQVLAYELGSDALKEKIAKSKFKDVKGFGVKTPSPILLQDHNDELAFRNIKIRPLTK
ncbi:MAG: 3-keto-disaccharide hydrolase [Chthoniobacteraceae bacterium]